MLKSLTLKNFKPFENQSFELRALTLLSGLNSSGKSSLLQSLLLLRQSYQQKLLPDIGLALNGDLVCIGTAQDALFEGAKEDIITFEIDHDNTLNKWVFNYDSDADVIEKSSDPEVSDNIYQSSLFNDNFCYLQAERISPKPYFETSDFQVKQHKQIGNKGEFASHFLSINESEEIANKKLAHPAEQNFNLKLQVEAWIGEISPGTRIEIESYPKVDIVSLQYFYGLSKRYRSTNVGFGITYTLPILIALLSATPDTLILLENPEAHLHPKGQSIMGELLALAASCGVQIIVETHSDHILNGIRLAVRRRGVKPEDIQLHYFDRYLQKGQAITKIISPRIYQDGGIDKWPDGFFDQAEKDLMELL
jgi:predicted ATPase